MFVLLAACVWGSTPQWPDPCPGTYHPSEANYAVAYKQYSTLVLNYTSTREREYNNAVSEYRTKRPAYEKGVRAVDNRFWQLLVLRGQIVPLPRDRDGREQQQPPWDIDLLGEHDEKHYWESIKALGPKPTLPTLQPYHLVDVVGVDLVGKLAAHARLVTAWQAEVFNEKKARVVFGKLAAYDAPTLTATRNAFALTGTGICERGPIPLRVDFERVYNATVNHIF